jgi:hypothetical protein
MRVEEAVARGALDRVGDVTRDRPQPSSPTSSSSSCYGGTIMADGRRDELSILWAH